MRKYDILTLNLVNNQLDYLVSEVPLYINVNHSVQEIFRL